VDSKAAADRTRSGLAAWLPNRARQNIFDIIFFLSFAKTPCSPVIEPARGDAQFENIVRKEFGGFSWPEIRRS